MIEVIGGGLFQWDTGRIALVKPDTDVEIHEVHFTTKDMKDAYVVNTYEQGGMILCAIPNEILQQEKNVIAYEVTKTETGEMTASETTLPLKKRNKPQDYVYTESEILNYETLKETALTSNELSALVEEVNGGE